MLIHPQEALLQEARALQTERCLRPISNAPGGGGTQIGPAGPSGYPPVPLFRTRQDEIPAVPGGHGCQPDPGGGETRTIRLGWRRFQQMRHYLYRCRPFRL